MEMNEYQRLALRTWTPSSQAQENELLRLSYVVLGVTGEAGEVAEKVKKLIRNFDGKMTGEYRLSIAKELGDVLWYLSMIAYELGLDLDVIAQLNIDKLSDRLSRGVIKSEGDER